MKTYFERPVTRGGTGFNDEHVCGYWSDSDKKWDSQRSRAEFFKTSKIIEKYCLSSEIQCLEIRYLGSSGSRVFKRSKKLPIRSYVRQRSSTATVGVANMSKIISHGTLTGFVCFSVSLNTQRLGIFEPGPEPGPQVPVVGPGWALWDAGALRAPRGSKHFQNHVPDNSKGFCVFTSVSDHPQIRYFWTEEPKPGPQI